MLEVNVISTGSQAGNCCVLADENTKIMIDAGITLKKIQTALEYQLPDYLLITHEHRDHVNLTALKTLLQRGVEVYMTAGTKKALGLEDRYNLHIFNPSLTMTAEKIGEYEFSALMAVHDAEEPAVFKIVGADEKILYATDTGQVPEWNLAFTKILIEANFAENVLAESLIDAAQKERIFKKHLSIEKVMGGFEYWDKYNLLGDLKEVHLLHKSSRHGLDNFADKVSEVVGCKVWQA